MPFFEAINPLYVLSGLVVGSLVGMTGVGGGSLMTPLLILLFHVHPVTAVTTDLLFASITKVSGSVVHGLSRTIEWRVVTRLAAGSLPAAALTLIAMAYFKIDGSSANMFITKVLGCALLVTALTLVFRQWLLSAYARWIGNLSPRRTRNFTILTGIALGILVTISSVGAAALGVTALLLLYPELPIMRIVGSDIAHAVPLTLVAGLGHLVTGGIDLTLMGSLLLGSLPGVVLGSLCAPRIPDKTLRLVLAATLTLVAMRLLVGS